MLHLILFSNYLYKLHVASSLNTNTVCHTHHPLVYLQNAAHWLSLTFYKNNKVFNLSELKCIRHKRLSAINSEEVMLFQTGKRMGECADYQLFILSHIVETYNNRR